MVERSVLLHEVRDPNPKIYQEYLLFERTPSEIVNNCESASELRSDRPWPETIVHIPVAADQEQKNIYHTLSQYALQQGNTPFAIVMNVNNRYDADPTAVDQTMSEITRAQKDFSHLDIRYFTAEYDDPIIGKIRRDLWGATIQSYMNGQPSTDGEDVDVLGINNDADVQKLSPYYVHNIRTAYDARGSDKPAYLKAKAYHSRTAAHPNVNRVVAWYDQSIALQREGFEASMAIPWRTYCLNGGIDAKDATYEIGGLLWRAEDNGMDSSVFVNNAHLVTSSRRFVRHLPDNTITDIWQNTFHDNPECRTEDGSTPDIDEDRAQSRAREIMYMALVQLDKKDMSIAENRQQRDWQRRVGARTLQLCGFEDQAEYWDLRLGRFDLASRMSYYARHND